MTITIEQIRKLERMTRDWPRLGKIRMVPHGKEEDGEQTVENDEKE